MDQQDSTPYADLIQTLPSEPWSDGHLYQFKGFWFRQSYLKGTLAVHDHFKPLPTDVLLASFPKTGTTWLKSLLFSIINRSSMDSLLLSHPHDLVPSLEFQVYRAGTKPSMPESMQTNPCSRRIFSTHIPYQLLPPSIKDSSCKIVYVTRNPLDTIVSQWKFVSSSKYLNCPITVDEVVDAFCKGAVPYGPYFDHVRRYWEESGLEGSRVLFLTYEDLKCDAGRQVRKLGEFLGCPFEGGEGDGEVEEIVRRCSFEKLRNVEVNKSENEIDWFPVSYNSFFRKGQVGDHKNYLTPEMVEKVKKLVGEKMKGSGLILF